MNIRIDLLGNRIIEPTGSQSIEQLYSDYHGAVLRLIYITHDSKSFSLVFGLARLIPNEQPLPEPWPPSPKDKEIATWSKRNIKVFYRKIVFTDLHSFMSWWNNANTPNFCIPHTSIKLETSELSTEPENGLWNLTPPWPYIIEEDFPHFSFRTQHKLAIAFDDALKQTAKTIHQEPFQSGLKNLLGKKFAYLENSWLGSIHVEAPNPVYRSATDKRGQGRSGNDILVNITPRVGKSLNNVTFLYAELRPTGIGIVHTFKADHSNIFLTRNQDIEKIMYLSYCNIRGPLEVQGPAHYLRSISLQENYVLKRIKIHLPKTAHHPEEIIHQNITTTHTDHVEAPTNTPIKKLRSITASQNKSNQAKKLDQKCFFHQSEEAKSFLRRIIKGATTNLIIIDPYLMDQEYFKYATSASQAKLNIIIVTSEKFIKNEDKYNQKNSMRKSENFYKRVLDHKKATEQQVEIRILKGKNSPIHDRFIIVDDNIWLIGGSLNTFGDSLSTVTRIVDPAPVYNTIMSIIETQSESMDVWLSRKT